jgi:thioredoxin-like negative regulator of GroEL
MSVKRISKYALDQIVAGKVREPATCVIKFYSNSCHLCHNLQEYYDTIAKDDQYSDLHFFAFNIEEYPKIEKLLGFRGVPSILLFKVGIPNKRIRVLQDPDEPNEHTWYTSNYIRSFIEREK